MNDRAFPAATESLQSDNQARREPRLPGSSMPPRGPLPLAYIYQPAPAVTQSAPALKREWVLEFAPWDRRELDFLMGWTSSRDPFHSIPRLRFPDLQSAINFAERQGWQYVVKEPPARVLRPKSYADNFRYDLAGSIARAQKSWDGTVSIKEAQTLRKAKPDLAAAARGSVSRPQTESHGHPIARP